MNTSPNTRLATGPGIFLPYENRAELSGPGPLFHVPMAPGQIIGFMGTFASLTLVSIYFMVVLFRGIAEPAAAKVKARA